MDALTYNQIKQIVGDAWALIANPVYSTKSGKFSKGLLVFFDKDKQKVHEKSLNCNFNHLTVRYFGEIDNFLCCSF